jgi:hypothetical protein
MRVTKVTKVTKVSRWRQHQCGVCGESWPASCSSCLRCIAPLDGGIYEVVRSLPARSGDPDTSKLSAREKEPSIETDRGRILAVFRREGRDLYASEAAELAGIPDGWKRVSELLQLGLIHLTGTTINPKTGRRVQTYRSSDARGG